MFPVSLTSESYPYHRDRWALFANKMCLWIFYSNLRNESAKDLKVQCVWLVPSFLYRQFRWYSLLGEDHRWFWACGQTTLSKARLLDVICKTQGCIPHYFCTMLISVSLLSFVPPYYNNNAKTFNGMHKMEFKKGRKRGIAVFYLFEHSLISTHLSKLK